MTKQNQKNNTRTKRKLQKLKKQKNKTEVLELKNRTSELKNSTESFIRRLDKSKDSVILKTGHLKLYSQRNKKKKN
jgi:hypothetical protein